MKINYEEFKKILDEYLETLDDEKEDEFYGTDRRSFELHYSELLEKAKQSAGIQRYVLTATVAGIPLYRVDEFTWSTSVKEAHIFTSLDEAKAQCHDGIKYVSL